MIIKILAVTSYKVVTEKVDVTCKLVSYAL